MRRCDPISDPEDVVDPVTRRRGIDNFASFMRLLAPVAPRPLDEAGRDGERLFNAIGCATCHTPTLTTARHANPLFDQRPVPFFSDLLLHDVGTGDGIAQGAAEPQEIRTPALWGLGLRKPFLHDGSASTIEEAVELKAGTLPLARHRPLRDLRGVRVDRFRQLIMQLAAKLLAQRRRALEQAVDRRCGHRDTSGWVVRDV